MKSKSSVEYVNKLFENLKREKSIWKSHFDISLLVMYDCEDCDFSEVCYKYGLVALEIGFDKDNYVSPIFEQYLRYSKLPNLFERKEYLDDAFPIGIVGDSGLNGMLFLKIVNFFYF